MEYRVILRYERVISVTSERTVQVKNIAGVKSSTVFGGIIFVLANRNDLTFYKKKSTPFLILRAIKLKWIGEKNQIGIPLTVTSSK